MSVVVEQIREKYQSDGIIGLLRAGPEAVYTKLQIAIHSRRDSNFYYQFVKEEGVDERWELIEPHLEENTAVLDIGCNAGLFTKRAADRNCFAVGLEKQTGTVRDAIQYHGHAPDFGLINKPITAETVTSLPTFDYTLLFSVYHHIYRHEGQEAAKTILNTLAEKTNDVIFFEPASRKELYGDQSLPFTDNNMSEVREYNEDMLKRVIDQEINVEYLGSRSQGTKTERCVLAIRMA